LHGCSNNENANPYEFVYNSLEVFSSKVYFIYSPSELVSSFALILSVSEFRNKNADKRSEANKKQKEKRRKLNEETPPEKENDPADDAKENDE
jgi:hypothetical protein